LRLETDRYAEGLNENIASRTARACQAFHDAMNDDLNTAGALGAVFEYIRDANSVMDSGDFRAGNVEGALGLLGLFDRVFDVLQPTTTAGSLTEAEIEVLVAERTAAKKARNFALADRIRDQLLERGIILEDTKAGMRWKRK
jgi:cysteinyl-tRNA synthetase